MAAIFTFGNGFVTAGGVSLAFFAGLTFFVGFHAAFVIAIFAGSFGFHAAAFGESGTRDQNQGANEH
jgi:hypothetical protein